VDRALERKPETVRLGKDSRRDPQLTSRIYVEDFRRTTLAFTEPTPSLGWNRFAADLLANCAS
jgi:hypothetical protein